jgi:hypothetical protein
MPFLEEASERTVDFVIKEYPEAESLEAQKGKTEYKYFTLQGGFRYVRPAKQYRWVLPDKDEIGINPKTLGATDLASIPWFMGWFVSSYGIHAAATLVHDQYVDDPDDDMTREEADDLLFEALGDCQRPVPFLRRSMIWAAVTIGTRFGRGGLPRIFILLWIAAALAGTALLVYGLASGKEFLALIALLLPFPAMLLWGLKPRRWWGAIVASYTIPITIPASLLAIIAFGAYWVLEQIFRAVLWVLHRVPVVRDWGWLARLRGAELDCKRPIGRPGFAEIPRPTAFKRL